MVSHTRYIWLNFIYKFDMTDSTVKCSGSHIVCDVRQLESRKAPRGFKFLGLCMKRCVELGINSGCMTASALLCSTFLVQPDCFLDLCAQYSVLEHRLMARLIQSDFSSTLKLETGVDSR